MKSKEQTVKIIHSRKNIVLFTIIGILGGTMIGWAIGVYFLIPKNGDVASASNTPGCNAEYKYINTEIPCDEFNETLNKISSIQKSVQNEVSRDILEGRATRISVWSRDLPSKQYLAVNQNEKYSPASLAKLPLGMAAFKYAEIEPVFLTKKVLYDGKTDLDSLQIFKTPPEGQLIPGKSYTNLELIDYMLKYSDNNAAVLLFEQLDHAFVRRVNLDIGIQISSDADPSATEDFVTVRSYANLFRILYNASYLNRDYSEKMISILTGSSFMDGARKGIPKNIVMAHKFGERVELDANNVIKTAELHDCGIVYVGKNIYNFCIMTEGTDLTELDTIIGEISSTIYQGFNNN